ncbi:MAG: N-acetylmuramoyl-L-alanine amidase [Eubacteriales bacterium]|nr:N-acetylmuramoyl-L-alanine amidase [Eubacteriales bacterium]
MKQTLRRLMEKKTARLRACILLFFACLSVGLITSPPESVTPTESALAAKLLEGFTVAVDPGHGGYDGGARAHDSGLWEKDVTLTIALELEKVLINHGANVVLTRREDVCLCEGNTASRARKRQDLQERVNIAIAAEADVLISVHLNEYRSRSQSGPQIFYQRGGDAGRLLAGVLQQAMIRELKPKKERVAMAGDYYVLRSKLPSALVECGFLSNAEEEKLLLDADYQKKIAQAIAQGLCEYRELLQKTKQNGQ